MQDPLSDQSPEAATDKPTDQLPERAAAEVVEPAGLAGEANAVLAKTQDEVANPGPSMLLGNQPTPGATNQTSPTAEPPTQGTANPDQPEQAARSTDSARAQQWLVAARTGIFGAISQASPARGPQWAVFPPKPPHIKAKSVLWVLALAAVTVLVYLELDSSWSPAGPLERSNLATTSQLAAVQLLVPAVFAASLTRLYKGPLSTWRWQTAVLIMVALTTGNLADSVLAILVYGVVLLMVGWYQEPATLLGVGAVTTVLVVAAASSGDFNNAVALTALALLPLFIGRLLGTRAASRRELHATKEALGVRSEHAAVLAERARIARDLHDVVAHQMSLIAIQAEAADLRTPDLPDSARQSLALIRQAASDALAETRSIVGILRADEGEAAERAPAPNLDGLAELVASAQRSGVPVTLAVHGAPRQATAATGLAAYRIVQESLANANRHAPGQPVQIDLEWQADSLEVTVLNSPATNPDDPAAGPLPLSAEPAAQPTDAPDMADLTAESTHQTGEDQS